MPSKSRKPFEPTRRPSKGDRPRATDLTDVYDHLSDNPPVKAGPGVDITDGHGGATLSARPDEVFGMFEIMERVRMPDPDRTACSDDEPDVPWTENAEIVFLNDMSCAMGSYETQSGQEVDIYFPTVVRNQYGIGVGPPSSSIGDRVFAFFNKQSGRWEAIEGGGCVPHGIMLAVDHPGERGIPFAAWRGAWCEEENKWRYQCDVAYDPASEDDLPPASVEDGEQEADIITVIDWRYGAPFPDKYAQGLAVPRPSAFYGEIWEIIDLDCESDDNCQAHALPCSASGESAS